LQLLEARAAVVEELKVPESALLMAKDQAAISSAGRVEDTDSVSHDGEGDRTAAKFTGGGGVGCAEWTV